MNTSVSLDAYQITVFVVAMVFLSIGLWVGNALGRDNRQPRDSRGRYIKP